MSVPCLHLRNPFLKSVLGNLKVTDCISGGGDAAAAYSLWRNAFVHPRRLWLQVWGNLFSKGYMAWYSSSTTAAVYMSLQVLPVLQEAARVKKWALSI